MGSTGYPLDSRGLPIPDGSWPPGREAPARLEVVRRFCNTQNMESGADLLRSPQELARYLVAEGFRVGDRPLGSKALSQVLGLRAALRAMVTASAEPEACAAALATFDRAAENVRVRVRLSPYVHLAPVRDGVDAFLTRIVDAVFVAHVDGTWRRLRACAHCGWVVYDQSKNASSIWCSPLACGTRMKARAWRARQRH